MGCSSSIHSLERPVYRGPSASVYEPASKYNIDNLSPPSKKIMYGSTCKNATCQRTAGDPNSVVNVGLDFGVDDLDFLPDFCVEDLNVDSNLSPPGKQNRTQSVKHHSPLVQLGTGECVIAGAVSLPAQNLSSTYASAGVQKLIQESSPSCSTQSIGRGGEILSAHYFRGYLSSAPWVSSIDCMGNCSSANPHHS